LSDSSVYITYNNSYAASGRWLIYNYITREVSVYKEPDTKKKQIVDTNFKDICNDLVNCDWRDSTSTRNLVNKMENSNIDNYLFLRILSGQYLDHYNKPDKAMKYANRLITVFPDVETGYYNKGLILEKQKKYNEAIIEYKKALDCKINCDYSMALAYEHLAFAYENIGSNDYAKEYAIKALEINNQYWIPTWFNERIDKLKKIAK